MKKMAKSLTVNEKSQLNKLIISLQAKLLPKVCINSLYCFFLIN